MDANLNGYTTLRSGAEVIGEYVDRKSRFIAQIRHVETQMAAVAHIEAVRSRHRDARHNVPVWVLADGSERASDDGEPQRTAGQPALEALKAAGLRDVCCVITRYFGGTLLGPAGLRRAYSAAVQCALEDAQAQEALVEMTQVVPVSLRVAYADFSRIQYLLQTHGGKMTSSEFSDEVQIAAVFRAGDERSFVDAVSELYAGQREVCVDTACFAEF